MDESVFSLNALTPLDGRYHKRVEELAKKAIDQVEKFINRIDEDKK